MLTELALATALTTALAHTGGDVINGNPQDVYEGVSGCAAYSVPMEQRACTGRVLFAWGPYVSDSESLALGLGGGAYSASSGLPVDPLESAPPVMVSDSVPVVSDVWEVCEHPPGQVVEHVSGLDWSELTEDWSAEDLDRCF